MTLVAWAGMTSGGFRKHGFGPNSSFNDGLFVKTNWSWKDWKKFQKMQMEAKKRMVQFVGEDMNVICDMKELTIDRPTICLGIEIENEVIDIEK